MNKTFDLTQEAARVHDANAKWWVDLETGAPLNRNWGEMCMLVISELAEALEGARKDLMDDKLPHRKMLEVELADAMIRLLDMAGHLKVDFGRPGVWIAPRPVEFNVAEQLLHCTHYVLNLRDDLGDGRRRRVELGFSECIERIVSLAAWLGFDIFSAYEEKMSYNAIRHDHTIEARKQANGKKF